MQVTRVALVLRLGMEAGDAPPFVVGVERQVQADGALSDTMGLSMPQTKHMRELGCFSMMLPPCASRVIASTWGLGKSLPPEAGTGRRLWMAGLPRVFLQVATVKLTANDLCCTI